MIEIIFACSKIIIVVEGQEMFTVMTPRMDNRVLEW